MGTARTSRFRCLVETIETIQVELHGKYSTDRLLALHAYSAQTSLTRIVAAMAVAPLPCLFSIVIVDVFPLAPPTEPYHTQTAFWARLYLGGCMIGLAMLEQWHGFFPQLPLSTPRKLAIVAVAIAVTSAYGYGWAVLVGFPVPFIQHIITPVSLGLHACGVAVSWRPRFLADAALRQTLKHVSDVVSSTVLMMFLYPMFLFIFALLRGSSQVAFTLLLPVIKLAVKNAVFVGAGPLGDLAPEIITFTVDVFHSLFVSYAMQASTTYKTTGVVMAMDAVQAWLTVRDVTHMLDALAQLKHASASPSFARSKYPENPLDRSAAILQENDTLRDHAYLAAPFATHLRWGKWWRTIRRVSSVPAPAVGDDKIVEGPRGKTAATRALNAVLPFEARTPHTLRGDDKERAQLEYVYATLRLLFLVEFVMLVEFIEVIIPLIYATYLMAMSHLSNLQYYPALRSLDAAQLRASILNVVAYAALEFVSFVAMAAVLKSRLGFSPLHQVGFVLESKRRVVQSRLVLWVFINVQNTLEHFGADFSFQFHWLHKKA